MTQNPSPKQVVTEKDAAHYISMSVAYLRAARLGRGRSGPPFFRIGRAVRYAIEDLDRWLESKRVGGRSL